ncbi:hypothetical protein VTK26DRAFT_6421 [Humicola hyalothermophila]
MTEEGEARTSHANRGSQPRKPDDAGGPCGESTSELGRSRRTVFDKEPEFRNLLGQRDSRCVEPCISVPWCTVKTWIEVVCHEQLKTLYFEPHISHHRPEAGLMLQATQRLAPQSRRGPQATGCPELLFKSIWHPCSPGTDRKLPPPPNLIGQHTQRKPCLLEVVIIPSCCFVSNSGHLVQGQHVYCNPLKDGRGSLSQSHWSDKVPPRFRLMHPPTEHHHPLRLRFRLHRTRRRTG